MERIRDLLDKLNLYLDPGKYSFDFVKVAQLLTEAVQVMDDTARGVRPKGLPEEIPFSDSLDEEGRSSPYCYAGDMSPEEYDRTMELHEQDHPVVSQPQNTPEKEVLFDNSEGRRQQPGHKLLCIRIFDQDGEFHGGDTGPFDESRLNWWIESVKNSIFNPPGGAASFTVYQWDSETKSWSLYRPDGVHEMTYDIVNKTEFG